ncbi:hypothetical protein ABEB36_004724 [Hypothenemus hampei]|uniref:Myb/SANT-like DNA-binding domain-containing protein n=1 Tax=Hypothenemus hampei TaxID=57062 RepID=A0ABD1F4A7_HYPHA
MDGNIREANNNLIEFIDLDEPETEQEEGCVWNQSNSKILIDLYKLYRSKVGTTKLKNFKKLWELLAHLLKKKHNLNFTPAQIENRWRVLERNYKKVQDNNNKTGRARKNFEFQEEMNALFGKKRNINPKILLSSTTISHPKDLIDEENEKTTTAEVNDNKEPKSAVAKEPKNAETKECNTRRRLNKKNTANVVLEKMRHDKLKFYESKLKILQERNDIEKNKLLEMKRKNDLLEDRNKLINK